MISRHVVGNAVVLHARDRISTEARTLALAVAADPANEIVVLDLHDDLPVGIWKAVADAIKRKRGRGIRLVVCGAARDTGMLAAQWLSDRLRRPVVVPHGQVIPGAAGTLFVHGSGEGSGWVRYSPGRQPVWEAKRYPAPPWDEAAKEFVPTSSVGAVEPIPAGVWIRDTTDTIVDRRWQWLASSVPAQDNAMTVVLGCPGTASLALDDVARFWRGLAASRREHARFVQYGPVSLPEGETLGQRLADLLEEPVVCFTGMPMGRPDDPHMHTVMPSGQLGWQSLVRELGFSPRRGRGARAPQPRVLSHRAPSLFGREVGPRTYDYAPDAVVEIVQSGLWIRPAEAPAGADKIRARPADPSVQALIVDDTDPVRVPRFRELALDLAGRLESGTREASVVHLASELPDPLPVREKAGPTTTLSRSELLAASSELAGSSGLAGSSVAAGNLNDGSTVRFTKADLARDAAQSQAPVVTPPPAEPMSFSIPDVESSGAHAVTDVGSQPVAYAAADPVAEPVAPPVADSLSLSPVDVSGGFPAPSVGVPAVARPDIPATPARTGRTPDRDAEPDSHGFLAGIFEPGLLREPDHEAPGPGLLHAPVARPADSPLGPPADLLAGLPVGPPVDSRAGLPVAAPENPPSLGEPPRTILPENRKIIAVPVDRPSTVDNSRTVVRTRHAGGATEGDREEVRRRFGSSFAAVSGEIERLVADHHGLELADAVALRLYLTEPGDDLDDELRSGGTSALARSAASALTALPAHRGAACTAATMSVGDLQELGSRRVLTNPAFTHAVIEPSPNLPGNVDVLFWSMTARRTRAFEPEGTHRVGRRVVFAPGTSFKVLQAQEPGEDHRGRLLLRELSADEPNHDRGPFDDLALGSLHRCLDQWNASGRYARVGEGAIGRFVTLTRLL